MEESCKVEVISIYSGKARDPEGCSDRQDSARVVIKCALDLFSKPFPPYNSPTYSIYVSLFLCDFSLSHPPITRRAMPIVGRYLTINFVSVLTRMYRISCSSLYKEPKPTLFLPLSLSPPPPLPRPSYAMSLFISPWRRVIPLLFWFYHTPPKFIPPSRGSAQPSRPFLLSFSATHMLAMQKNLPSPPPFSRATEVRGIISRIKADSARYQATPQATGCGILRARIALNLSLVR